MHVVITGSSSGIGACLAREYHSAGAHVTLVARRTSLLEKLRDELAERCEVVVADLSTADCTRWLGARPIDVFINNAGFNITGPFDFADDAEVAKMFQVDLLAPIALARAVVPAMRARGHGTLINISSVAGIVPPAGMACYSAAKAGLAAFSEALNAELSASGVHVLTVYPGPIDNGNRQDSLTVYGPNSMAGAVPWGQAKDLARAIRRAAEARNDRLIFPRFYNLSRGFPSIARFLVNRFTPQMRLPALAASTR